MQCSRIKKKECWNTENMIANICIASYLKCFSYLNSPFDAVFFSVIFFNKVIKRDWKGFQCLTVRLDTFWNFLRRLRLLGLFDTFGTFWDLLRLIETFETFWDFCNFLRLFGLIGTFSDFWGNKNCTVISKVTVTLKVTLSTVKSQEEEQQQQFSNL